MEHVDGDFYNRMTIDMETEELYKILESIYPDGGYVSRLTLFNRALREGKISDRFRCHRCGTDVDGGHNYCRNCGARLKSPSR